ncbi:pyridoxamine 5'-phosphate oxidase family protein [Streptomyces sp. NPDC021093]|uniref:pyridoxamine 5'-phosphate oxidase family protein n=1 Tax=Streptomyces sp. NPDC021093 TaxID=3365112 RepID=UPI0037965739
MPTSDSRRAIQLLTSVPYGRVATSMRALPFLAVARHVVVDGGILLRMHAGYGYHQACNGSVVAYETDNFNSGDSQLWSVQATGEARIVEPTPAGLKLFGPGPAEVEGKPFEAVHMRIDPQFFLVHTLQGSCGRTLQHAG